MTIGIHEKVNARVNLNYFSYGKTINADEDEDGNPNYKWLDSDDDGNAELEWSDVDDDGIPEWYWYDPDDDGIFG